MPKTGRYIDSFRFTTISLAICALLYLFFNLEAYVFIDTFSKTPMVGVILCHFSTYYRYRFPIYQGYNTLSYLQSAWRNRNLRRYCKVRTLRLCCTNVYLGPSRRLDFRHLPVLSLSCRWQVCS